MEGGPGGRQPSWWASIWDTIRSGAPGSAVDLAALISSATPTATASARGAKRRRNSVDGGPTYVSVGSEYGEDPELQDALGAPAGASHRTRRQPLSEGRVFQFVVATVIILNIVVVALEAQCVRRKDTHAPFQIAEVVLTSFYLVEVLVKFHDHGVRGYLLEHVDWGWNIFDFVVTVVCVVDALLTLASGAQVSSSGTAVSTLRILRVTRAFRVLRFLSEFDVVMVSAAISSMKFFTLVIVVLFLFAVAATNLLWDFPDPAVAAMYQDLGHSMWSMFKIMTLDSWVATVDAVLVVYPQMVFFFGSFVFIAGLSLISVVPAIFIELHMNAQKAEEEALQALNEEAKRKKVEKMVKGLFVIVDADGSGTVSVSEMQQALQDSEMMGTLREHLSRECTAEDVDAFKLGLYELWEDTQLSANDEAQLNQQQFVEGVLRNRENSLNQLWRCVTTSRMQMRAFADRVEVLMQGIRATVDTPLSPTGRRAITLGRRGSDTGGPDVGSPAHPRTPSGAQRRPSIVTMAAEEAAAVALSMASDHNKAEAAIAQVAIESLKEEAAATKAALESMRDEAAARGEALDKALSGLQEELRLALANAASAAAVAAATAGSAECREKRGGRDADAGAGAPPTTEPARRPRGLERCASTSSWAGAAADDVGGVARADAESPKQLARAWWQQDSPHSGAASQETLAPLVLHVGPAYMPEGPLLPRPGVLASTGSSSPPVAFRPAAASGGRLGVASRIGSSLSSEHELDAWSASPLERSLAPLGPWPRPSSAGSETLPQALPKPLLPGSGGTLERPVEATPSLPPSLPSVQWDSLCSAGPPAASGGPALWEAEVASSTASSDWPEGPRPWRLEWLREDPPAGPLST